MKILEKTSGGFKFNLEGDSQVLVMDIEKDNLYAMMELVYKNPTYYDFDDASDVLEQIKNPVEEVIATQIIKKISDFSKEVGELKARLDAQYPVIEPEV